MMRLRAPHGSCLMRLAPAPAIKAGASFAHPLASELEIPRGESRRRVIF